MMGVLSHMSHMTSHLTIYQMAILFLLGNSVVLPVKKIGFQMLGLLERNYHKIPHLSRSTFTQLDMMLLLNCLTGVMRYGSSKNNTYHSN